MTAITTTAPVDFTSDATFRNWVTVWHNAFTSLGWVQTADTGQLNLATVLKPTVANTPSGYEIWRMNDALQGTTPVFLKIEYGSGLSAATYPGIWLTVGFATDGAGTISSTNKSTRVSHYETVQNATAQDWKFSGSTGRFGALQAATSTNQRIYVFLERMHNNDGTDNANGVMLVCGGQSSSNSSQIIPATGTVPPMNLLNSALGNIGSTTSPTAVSNQWGSNVYLAPVRIHGMGEQPPMNGCAAYFTTDLTTYNLTTVTNWDGNSVTMYPSGYAPSYYAVPSGLCLAMRFD